MIPKVCKFNMNNNVYDGYKLRIMSQMIKILIIIEISSKRNERLTNVWHERLKLIQIFSFKLAKHKIFLFNLDICSSYVGSSSLPVTLITNLFYMI